MSSIPSSSVPNDPPPAGQRLSDGGLSTLFDVAEVRNTESLVQYLSRAADGIARWFRASGATLFLREDGEREFALAARSGPESRVPKDAVVRLGVGIAGACAATGEPMLFPAPNNKVEFLHAELRRPEIGSSMIVPLVAPDLGCFGVLSMWRHVGAPPLGVEDLELARVVAGHLALAITNARLLARLGESLQEARASNQMLEAVVDAAGVGLLVLDAKQRLVAANPEADRILCSSPRIGKTLPNSVSPHVRGLASAIRSAAKRASEGRRSRVEISGGNSSGTWLVSCSPIGDLGSVITLQELTDTVRAQEELARIRRLAEIGQMAAAIAHEIRNPLTGIKGAAQLVRDDPEQVAEFAQVVAEEVDKLNALCDGFLEFSRPMRLSLRPSNLKEVVSGVVKSMRLEFGARDVRCDLRTTGSQPIIQADPLRLEQVVRNVLLNALQACGEGGRVTVELSGAELTVRDNGSGMTRETRERLFTPFFTTKPSGSGLGLSNVRKILDAHGASIDVQSRKGAGTTVQITFEKGAGE